MSVDPAKELNQQRPVAAGPEGAAYRFCLAPMMECTDRHFRFLARLLSRRTRLYTEMVTAAALMRGKDTSRFLAYHPAEHPVALQIGGSNPADLAKAAAMGAAHGYDEINLNVGCPSEKVQEGRFGACLMAEPALVAQSVQAMRQSSALPVTVKTRIGIDDMDADHHLDDFVTTVASAGCKTFIIHARKAWLKGLSPKENREIPPLDYMRVHRLKRDFPHLTIVLNGGLKNLADAAAVLVPGDGQALDGVMVGRATYDNPYMMADVDGALFGDKDAPPTREEVVSAFLVYARHEISRGTRPHHVLRHAVNLYHGCAGARSWRQAITRAGQGEAKIDDLADLAARLTRQPALAA